MNRHSTQPMNAAETGQGQWAPAGSPAPENGQTRIIDTELFIRQAFDSNPRKGYELLFKRYYEPLCNHAVRFVYARDIAEDIVIDIFSQFWQKKLHVQVTTSYRAYLFTSVRHAAYSYLRREFGREVSIDEYTEPVPEANASTPHLELQFNELYLKIEELVRALPPQSQKVFVMSRFEGRKNAAIAEELQISVKTVEGHITKVLAILRQSLREYGLCVLLVGFRGLEQGLHALFTLI